MLKNKKKLYYFEWKLCKKILIDFKIINIVL